MYTQAIIYEWRTLRVTSQFTMAGGGWSDAVPTAGQLPPFPRLKVGGISVRWASPAPVTSIIRHRQMCVHCGSASQYVGLDGSGAIRQADMRASWASAELTVCTDRLRTTRVGSVPEVMSKGTWLNPYCLPVLRSMQLGASHLPACCSLLNGQPALSQASRPTSTHDYSPSTTSETVSVSHHWPVAVEALAVATWRSTVSPHDTYVNQ